MGFVLMILFGIRAYAAEATLTIGNNKNSLTNYESVKGGKAGSALFFDAAYMSAYKGCRLTEVKIGVSDKTTDGAITIFLSHAIDEEPFYKETVDASKSRWNTFTLATPYVVDGSDLCIGYTLDGAKYACYGNALVRNREYVLDKDGEWAEYDGPYSASLLATLSGDMPEHNVRLGATNMPEYVRTGEVMDIFGYFQNLGVSTVNSLTLALYDGDNELCEERVGDLNVAPRREGSFALSTMKLNAVGERTLRLRIKAVNDGADAVDTDNWTEAQNVMCRDSYVQRKVLLELFSTERCTACPEAHHAIDAVTPDMDNLIEIGHHAGFYTDKFTIDESVAYEWFYPSYHVFAPAMLIDRMDMRNAFPDLFKYETPIMSASATNLKALYALEQKRPALVTVDLTTDWNPSSRSLGIDVSGEQLLPIATPDSLRLYVFLTEDSLYSTSQAGASDGFYHRHVPRKSLTPAWGEKVDVTAGYNRHFDVTLNDEWDEKHMRVVAFVANYNSTDPCDCSVLNAAKRDIIAKTSGIGSISQDSSSSDAWMITDLAGRTVARGQGSASLTAAYNALNKGMYVVKVGEKSCKRVLN